MAGAETPRSLNNLVQGDPAGDDAQLLQRLASGLRHHLNNQFMSIQGYASLLEQAASPEEVSEFARHIQDAARAAANLVAAWGDLRTRAGVDDKGCDLQLFLANLLPIVKIGLAGRTELELHRNAQAPEVAMPRRLLKRFFLELLTLLAECGTEGSRVVIEVRDGDPNRRCPNAAVGSVRALVTAPWLPTDRAGSQFIRDRVWAVTQRWGVCATLNDEQPFLCLCFAPGQQPDEPEDTDDRTRVDLPQRRQVMVVDDQEEVRELMVTILRLNAYDVVSFNDGRSALEYVRANRSRVGLVLLDMIMPGFSGRQTFSGLMDLDADLPVVILSGYGKGDDIDALLQFGARAYLSKPATNSEILKTVSEFIRPLGEDSEEFETTGPTEGWEPEELATVLVSGMDSIRSRRPAKVAALITALARKPLHGDGGLLQRLRAEVEAYRYREALETAQQLLEHLRR
jgi:CheY-like chemotaxis protein